VIPGVAKIPLHLALIIICAFVICGCQTSPDTDAIKRSFEWGQNRVPDIALRESEFRALNEIRNYPDTWKTSVGSRKARADS